jgi:hypothetical protein
MMTFKEAKAFRTAHDQDARTLTRTRKGELQATWRDEMQRTGVLDPGAGPATKDGLVADILDHRYPVGQLNQAMHVLYHAPSSRWAGCKHCADLPKTEPVDTSQLRPGDVVLEHGMRIRIDEVREYRPDGSSGADRAWSCPGTVLNLADVLEQHVIPRSFLETYGYDEGKGWIVEREDAWTVQGNTLATWTVELPRPEVQS